MLGRDMPLLLMVANSSTSSPEADTHTRPHPTYTMLLGCQKSSLELDRGRLCGSYDSDCFNVVS